MPDHVLLVDDDPRLVEALQIRLEALGYVVYTAGNGEEGVDIARRIDPQAIVLDVSMPGMDGLTVCRVLRAEDQFQATPIIVMSAITHQEAHRAALAAGASKFMGKPYQAKKLMETIQEAIEVWRANRSPRAA